MLFTVKPDAVSSDMAGWTVPEFSRKEINDAGRILANPDAESSESLNALSMINNWRSSHSFPLNTFQVTLRAKSKTDDSHSLVAQRIKRLQSITSKLQRFDTMQLAQMQDIGGCRAVLSSAQKAELLLEKYRTSDLKHKLVKVVNYIDTPKPSGYRGIHLIYRYFSDKRAVYNDLLIEMQFRSSLQHAWATAVETVGTFVGQSLKSSQGADEWLRFFALMGSAIAEQEKRQPVPGTPGNHRELVRELKEHVRSLNVIKRLRSYGSALRTLDGPISVDSHYYLLHLQTSSNEVSIVGFKANESQKANEFYLEVEESIKHSKSGEAVLVSVDSLASLRRAYPNYFLDTDSFIDILENTLRGERDHRKT